MQEKYGVKENRSEKLDHRRWEKKERMKDDKGMSNKEKIKGKNERISKWR